MTAMDQVESKGDEVRLGVVETMENYSDFLEQQQGLDEVQGLRFEKGDKLEILSSVSWLAAKNEEYEIGFIPRSCVMYVEDE